MRSSVEPCGNFYGGQGPQTLDATQYRFLDLHNPTTGAATITPNNVFVNSQGPYISYTPTPGQTGPFGRYWTQGQFRGFILLLLGDPVLVFLSKHWSAPSLRRPSPSSLVKCTHKAALAHATEDQMRTCRIPAPVLPSNWRSGNGLSQRGREPVAVLYPTRRFWTGIPAPPRQAQAGWRA